MLIEPPPFLYNNDNRPRTLVWLAGDVAHDLLVLIRVADNGRCQTIGRFYAWFDGVGRSVDDG